MRLTASLLGLLILADAGTALGVEKLYKVDEFNADIATAAGEISSSSTLTVQPGFAQSEAFGQIYRPNSSGCHSRYRAGSCGTTERCHCHQRRHHRDLE
jgi:hypothetical protein